MKLVELTLTLPAFMTHIPPPRLYVLSEKAAHFTTAEQFAKELETVSTGTEGIEENMAPPAALLVPEAHDADEVIEKQLINVLLTTRKDDDRDITSKTLEELIGKDDAS